MIKKTVLYFVSVTLLLFALRSLHYQGLLKQSQGYYAKLKMIFTEANDYEVLFLGSSRVEMHYNTRLFDSLTGKKSVNLGLAGASPQLAFSALSLYLENSRTPQTLFYEVDYHSIKTDGKEIKDFNNYFPFLGNAHLRQRLGDMDSRMTQFYFNPYYSWPYTGFKNLSTGIHNRLNIPNKTDSLYYKGFMKEVLRAPLAYIPTECTYTYFHPNNRAYLDSIIWLCKKNNIEVHLISSPMFAGGALELRNRKEIIRQINNIAKRHHIPYHNLSSLPFCNKRELFADHYHLNYGGSLKFTPYLSRLFNNKPVNNSLN